MVDAGPLAALARRADPADAGAQNNLGVVLLARGDRAGAAAAFSRALALDPRMTLARRNLHAAGGADVRARRIRELRARLRADHADLDARRELAPLLAESERIEDARRELDTLCALLPDDAGPCVQRALCEQRAGDLDAALTWLERALARDPRSALAHACMGEVLYHRGEPTRALQSLDDAVALAPDYADAHLARGFVLGELGRDADAADATTRALAINPALGRAHANLAASSLTVDDATRNAGAATTRTEGASGVRETGPDVHAALGVAFRQKGYFDEAVREYRRALVQGGDESEAVRALGELHLLRAAPDAALPHWTRLATVRGDDAGAWHGRAVAEHLAGRVDEAETSYRRGIACAASHQRARLHNDLAVLRAARGDAVDAVRLLASAIASDASLVVARLNHAQLLASLGRGEHALAEYRAALRVAPDSADAWAGMGSALAAAGRRAEARTALTRALDLDPTRADARYELGFLAAESGDHGAARRETEHALADAPLVTRRALTLAFDLGAGAEHAPRVASVALPAMADVAVRGFHVADDALDALLGDVLAPASDDRDAPPDGGASAYAMAAECLRAGLYERAHASASAALARGASRVEGLTTLGDVFAAQGFFGEALERYQEAALLDPGSSAARIGALRMLRETGRRGAARDAAEALLHEHPDDAEIIAFAALSRIDDGEIETARDAIERAAARARDLTTWTLVAAAWRALGERAHEAHACERAIVIAPTHAPSRLTLARALAALRRDADAVVVLERLLDDEPSNADARLELASLHAASGRRADARRLLVDVLEADAMHLDALALLGALLADEGRHDESRVAVGRVLRFDAEHALALAIDGELLARAGLVAQARERWRGVLARDPVSDGAARARAALAAHATSAEPAA